MPLCHLLVFISQLECPFVKKDVEKTFSSISYILESCKNTLNVTRAFPTLKLRTKRSILILNDLWKNHDGVIPKKLFSRAAIIEITSDHLTEKKCLEKNIKNVTYKKMMNKVIPITKKVIETQQQATDSALKIFLWTPDSYKRSKITEIIRTKID